MWQSLSGRPFPLPLSESFKHGLIAGRTCSMNETEYGRTKGARGGSNGMQYKKHFRILMGLLKRISHSYPTMTLDIVVSVTLTMSVGYSIGYNIRPYRHASPDVLTVLPDVLTVLPDVLTVLLPMASSELFLRTCALSHVPHMHTHTHTYTPHTLTHTHTHPHTHARTHTHVHTYTHTYTHTESSYTTIPQQGKQPPSRREQNRKPVLTNLLI